MWCGFTGETWTIDILAFFLILVAGSAVYVSSNLYGPCPRPAIGGSFRKQNLTPYSILVHKPLNVFQLTE
jgi:hypothetical protein